MRKSKFSETQIVGIADRNAAGIHLSQPCHWVQNPPGRGMTSSMLTRFPQLRRTRSHTSPGRRPNSPSNTRSLSARSNPGMIPLARRRASRFCRTSHQ